MPRAAIAFGSNLGDRVAKIIDALKALRQLDIKVTQLSRLYESAPAYVTEQPEFLNGAALVETNLPAHDLLKTVKEIEASLGRDANGQRWGPRPIDLDIIFYEDQNVSDGDHLIVPHPRWQERDFVKAPLSDLAPLSPGMTTSTTPTHVKDQGIRGLDKNLSLAAHMWHASGGEHQLGSVDLRCVMPMGRLGLWTWQGRSQIMGVLNVTPDSFSDGGKHNTEVDAAVQHARAMVAEGADIIDIGGQSTRPGATKVSPQEECSRIIPVIRALAADASTAKIPLSVDTFYAHVAHEAVQAGATLVNDVSGGTLDEDMIPTVAKLGVPYVLMHMRGTPQTMQNKENTSYTDVCADVAKELQGAAERALNGGIEPWRLILDPGLGFAKTVGGNLTLIAQLQRLRGFLPPPLRQLPLLLGPSRKGFLGTLTGKKDAAERDVATAAAAALCVVNSANIVRAHNVGAVRDGVRVADGVTMFQQQREE